MENRREFRTGESLRSADAAFKRPEDAPLQRNPCPQPVFGLCRRQHLQDFVEQGLQAPDRSSFRPCPARTQRKSQCPFPTNQRLGGTCTEDADFAWRLGNHSQSPAACLSLPRQGIFRFCKFQQHRSDRHHKGAGVEHNHDKGLRHRQPRSENCQEYEIRNRTRLRLGRYAIECHSFS